MSRHLHVHVHRDAAQMPSYGWAAVAKRSEAEALKQALWTKRNNPSLLDEEQQALLEKHGKASKDEKPEDRIERLVNERIASLRPPKKGLGRGLGSLREEQAGSKIPKKLLPESETKDAGRTMMFRQYTNSELQALVRKENDPETRSALQYELKSRLEENRDRGNADHATYDDRPLTERLLALAERWGGSRDAEAAHDPKNGQFSSAGGTGGGSGKTRSAHAEEFKRIGLKSQGSETSTSNRGQHAVHEFRGASEHLGAVREHLKSEGYKAEAPEHGKFGNREMMAQHHTHPEKGSVSITQMQGAKNFDLSHHFGPSRSSKDAETAHDPSNGQFASGGGGAASPGAKKKAGGAKKAKAPRQKVASAKERREAEREEKTRLAHRRQDKIVKIAGGSQAAGRTKDSVALRPTIPRQILTFS